MPDSIVLTILLGISFYLLLRIRPKEGDKDGEADRTLYIGSVLKLPSRSKKNLRRVKKRRILRTYANKNSPSSANTKGGRKENKV